MHARAQKFDEVTSDLEGVFVFRTGAFDTDFERLVRTCAACYSC